MLNRTEPEISAYTSDESYLEVTYTVDFKRFKYTVYTHDVMALFCRHMADVASTMNIPCSFNGITL